VAQLHLVRCMRSRVVLSLLLLVSFTGCDKWSDARVAETKRRGDIICHAIAAFQGRSGRLPAQLKDLQPDYLSDIPQPTAGSERWEYLVIDNGTNYNLQVLTSEHDPILQRQASGNWDYMK
jgi:hypothetical protein